MLPVCAGDEGVEPSSTVLETDVKPFNYAPKKSTDLILTDG